MTKKILLLANFLFLGLIFANSAKAVCPVCVVAVGAGVGLCRWLGIDDAISGLWIGGLIVSMIIWCLHWMKKRQSNFKFDWIIISVSFYFLTIYPLYYFDIMGHPLNKIFGVDKLLFGIVFGSITFLFSHWLNLCLKSKNQGKVYFPYQKVAIPVVVLTILSFVFYFIIKCY